MATWVTHLMIADQVLQAIPSLCRHEFMVGNIAPDCNVENEDWTGFTPPREVTHWMGSERKTAADCDRFLHEYVEPKGKLNNQEMSFLMGYYAHLITDAEFQRTIRDQERVKASWNRIKCHPVLGQLSVGLDETFDSVKKLITKEDRMKDIHTIERSYLNEHPNSGYLTDILPLTVFPEYLDFLPEGAIVRKIKVMGYMPQKEVSRYPYVCMTKDEYLSFVTTAILQAEESIKRYLNKEI